MTAQLLHRPIAPRVRRRTFSGLVLGGLLIATFTARADIQYSATSQKQDGSQPPAGTTYGGTLDGYPILPPPAPADFPGTLSWSVEGDPPPEPSEHTFSGGASTPARYFCGNDVCTTSVNFYTGDSDTQTCGGSCTFTTKHWARFGSVAGTVTLKNGAPVRDAWVVAGDPVPPHWWSRAVQTDSMGRFTFTRTDAKEILGAGWETLLALPIPASNNWGLHIDQVGAETPPYKNYLVGALNQTTLVGVQSSQLATVEFVFDLDDVDPFIKENPPNQRCEDGGDETVGQDSQCLACAGNPISVLTGNVFFDQTDAFVPGTVPLELSRSYNSADAYAGRGGLFGPGWSSTYERELVMLRSGILGIKKSNGNHNYFTEGAAGIFRPYNAANGRGAITQQDGNWVHSLLGGRRETYGANGRLVGLADKAGNVTTFQNDETGAILSVSAPGGRRLSFTYTSMGAQRRIASVSGPEGLIASYGYDAAGRLRSVSYPDGSGYTYSYDNWGQLTQMRDATGVVLESHAYVGGKGVTSERSNGVDRLTFTYGEGRTTVRDALGNETQYDWTTVDSVKRLTKITGPCGSCGGSGGETQEWTYDDAGRVATFIDGLGKTWAYTYDANGNRASVTDPLNRTTTYTSDDRGRALTITPPGGGGPRVFTYTAAGLASAANALGHTVSLGRSAQGAITSLTTAGGKTYTFIRNGHGDLDGIRDPLNRSLSYERDGVGRALAFVDALNRRTSFGYDRRGRIAKVTLPTGAVWGTLYDKGGRTVEGTDPLGRKTRYIYDAHGRLAAIVDPLQGTTRFVYDVMSRLIAITDASGHTTRRQLDAYGRTVRVTFPDQRLEGYTYDTAGRLRTVTDRRGVVTTYHRDDLGRIVEKSFSDGSPSVTFHYDARGRLDSAADGSDTVARSYDAADRLVSETSTANGSEVSYQYDNDGRRVGLSLDSEELVSYVWDDAWRLTSLARGAHAFAFGYNDANQRTSLSYPNGVHTSYSYDAASRLTDLTTTLEQATLAADAYVYDAAGNPVRKTTPEYADTYGYDLLDRLASVERAGGASGHGHYGYDPVGNRVLDQADDAVATSVFDEGNRLRARSGGGNLFVQGQLDEPATVTVNGRAAASLPGNLFEASVPAQPGANEFTVTARDARGNQRTSTYSVNVAAAAATYSYDENGNLVQAVDGPDTWTYEWTVAGQLRRVSKNAVEVARFAYDPFGRRIEKVASGTTVRYAYDGLDIVRESRNGTDNATYRYVHGPRMDEPLARENEVGELLCYHADRLGSVVAVTDAAGAVTSRRRYDAWGRPELGAQESGYAFTGREWDPETGLYYYRARYYDAKLGRFISEDPIGFLGGINSYAYARNNSARFIDPLGLKITYGGYSAADEAYVRQMVATIAGTERGGPLVDQLERSPRELRITLDLMEEPRFEAGGGDTDWLYFDPRETYPIQTECEIQNASPIRILAHELGHAATPDYLRGPGPDLEGRTINLYENPIAVELGLPYRMSYKLIPPIPDWAK